MQYRPPNANLDSGCQTVYIVTGYNGLQTLLVGAPGRRCWSYDWFIGVSLLTVARGIINTLCCSPNYAMQIMQINVLSMKVYIERNNLQL